MSQSASRHINVYAGSPLNRLAWLRTSSGFLNAMALSTRTRWILFNAGKPLVVSGSSPSLVYLSTESLLPFLGERPFFGQGKVSGEIPSDELKEHAHVLQAARHRGSPIVFLGILEQGGERFLPETEIGIALKTGGTEYIETFLSKDQGIPYFALDLADKDFLPNNASNKEDKINELLNQASGGQKLEWVDPRAAVGSMGLSETGVFAESRTMVDWNLRNKFCPGCGSRNYSMWGGWKVSCSSLLPWQSETSTCPSRIGLHNYAHPRTDPVAIILAVDQTGDKILLGRSRKFPPKLYSALAGFLEPAETFEDCVVREMLEEAGVKVWGIQYHSGQPWPYPANLMLGWYCRGDSTKEIRLDLDNELEDAKWYTRSEILAVLGHAKGTKLDSRTFSEKMEEEEQQRVLKEQRDGKAASTQAQDVASEGPAITFPPDSAMAGVLIRDWAEGRVVFPAESI